MFPSIRTRGRGFLRSRLANTLLQYFPKPFGDQESGVKKERSEGGLVRRVGEKACLQ